MKLKKDIREASLKLGYSCVDFVLFLDKEGYLSESAYEPNPIKIIYCLTCNKGSDLCDEGSHIHVTLIQEIK